jgi:hypothetical protein
LPFFENLHTREMRVMQAFGQLQNATQTRLKT